MTKLTMRQIIKQNKWRLLISSLVILLPIMVGLIVWKELPEQIATHWGIGGEADAWSGRFFAVFFPPLFLLVTHWICVFCTFLDKRNQNQSKKALGMILWMTPIISLFTNGFVYATAFGKEFSMDVVMTLVMGLMFAVIGNYLPKCKHNYTLGIKVKWALENEENWNATHRFGGKVWMIGGLLMMAGVFLPEELSLVVMLIVITILVVVPVVYSYQYHKKQCREESAVVEPMCAEYQKISKISLIIGVVVLALVGVLMVAGSIDYEIGEESLHVKTSFWSDMTVDYEKITKVEYREIDEAGSRTWGFGSARLLMGSFQNEEFGFYTRYSYTSCDACIVIEMGDEILVISAKDEEKTKQIYDELSQRI